MDSVPLDLVRSLLLMGRTYSEISSELQQLYPHIDRGLSTRSVRRYVKENGLRGVCDSDRQQAVEASISEVSLDRHSTNKGRVCTSLGLVGLGNTLNNKIIVYLIS